MVLASGPSSIRAAISTGRFARRISVTSEGWKRDYGQLRKPEPAVALGPIWICECPGSDPED
jgi:hypothetical protein